MSPRCKTFEGDVELLNPDLRWDGEECRMMDFGFD